MTEAVEAVGMCRMGVPGVQSGGSGDTMGNSRCFPSSYGGGSAPGLLEAWSAGVGSRLRPGKPLYPNTHRPAFPTSLISIRCTERTESGCEVLEELPPVAVQTGPLVYRRVPWVQSSSQATGWPLGSL